MRSELVSGSGEGLIDFLNMPRPPGFKLQLHVGHVTGHVPNAAVVVNVQHVGLQLGDECQQPGKRSRDVGGLRGGWDRLRRSLRVNFL